MQTTRREIDSFVARKSFKYNDVINSKIVNLDIWYHFRLLDESSRELESNSDLKLISSRVRRLVSSNRVESEDWYWVIESSQNVDMKIWLDDQPIHFESSFFLDANRWCHFSFITKMFLCCNFSNHTVIDSLIFK